MNIDSIRIGKYTVTNYAGRNHTLFNNDTGDVYNILPSEYAWLMENKSLETCNILNDFYERSQLKVFKDV